MCGCKGHGVVHGTSRPRSCGLAGGGRAGARGGSAQGGADAHASVRQVTEPAGWAVAGMWGGAGARVACIWLNDSYGYLARPPTPCSPSPGLAPRSVSCMTSPWSCTGAQVCRGRDRRNPNVGWDSQDAFPPLLD